MQSHSVKVSVRAEKEANEFVGSSLENNPGKILQEPVDVPSSTSSSSASVDESDETHDEDEQTNGDASKQLVLYDPTANGTGEIEPAPQHFLYNRAPFGRHSGPNMQSRVFPSVGAFTVQCANCFKWRLIPTKEKYEEIREHVLENPFVCERAREWRPDVSCDDPTDISQDGSRLWAIDKPNIAQPPPGWQRLLHIRAEGSTKFADVYYIAPSGKKLRSMVEIQKYLLEHPEYIRDDVTLSQFSFQTPKPLQENYVRKRVPRVNTSHDAPKGLEPSEVNPLSWVGPDNITDLRLGRPAIPPPPIEAPFSDLSPRPAKRRRAPKQLYRSSPTSIEPKFRAEEQEPGQSRNSNEVFEPGQQSG